MSTPGIIEVYNSYQDKCRTNKLDVNPLINTVLSKERELWKSDRQGKLKNTVLYLAGNLPIENLDFRRVTDSDLLILYQCLRSSSYIVGVDLRYNKITDLGAKYVAQLIQENKYIAMLNLMCNDITEDGTVVIAEALQTNKSLKILRLNGNKIGRRGALAISEALQVNTTLEALDLGDTDLTVQCLIALATVLHTNKSLRRLNVNRPILFSHQEETSVHYANLLKVSRTLQELHMRKHDMRDFGATRIAEALLDNMYLTYLDLNCNRITRDGAKVIAKLLKKNPGLKVLDLGYNRLEDEGAIHIADALSTYNTNLEKLSIQYNNIGGRGLCAFADALKLNCTLSHIYIWGNVLEESACIAFARLLDRERLLKCNVDFEAFTVDDIVKLSEQSNCLQRWYYWGPHLGEHARPEIRRLVESER